MNRRIHLPFRQRWRQWPGVKKALAVFAALMLVTTPAAAVMTVIDPQAIAQLMEVLKTGNEALGVLEDVFDTIETVEKTIGKLHTATVGRARKLVRAVYGAKTCVVNLKWMFDLSMPTSGSCNDFVSFVRDNLTVVTEDDATEAEVLEKLGNAGVEQLRQRRSSLHYDATTRALSTAMQMKSDTSSQETLNDIATDMAIPQTLQGQVGISNDLLMIIANETIQLKVIAASQLEMDAARELRDTPIVFRLSDPKGK
jgi:hypothetical protein